MPDDISIDFDDLSRETEAAWCVVIDSEEQWLPKSLCRIYPKTKKAWVPEWLAEKKGLI